MKQFLLLLHRLMLHLYPGHFYRTFGQEMAEVFAENCSRLTLSSPAEHFH